MRLPLIVFVFFISGCSSEQLYAIVQESQRNQCLKMPESYESKECFKNANMSYEEYKNLKLKN